MLAAAIAEPGAENGAGPEIHIDEPWVGYGAMRADEIRERITTEDDAVVAMVELYERKHRERRSVLETAARELRRRAGSTGNDA